MAAINPLLAEKPPGTEIPAATLGHVASATSTLLLLVDGRLPTGGHAHSGGIESAVADGRVGDCTSLERYLAGRLSSTGLVDCAFAAASALQLAPTGELNTEAIARCPSAALRGASQKQGRGLLRAASHIWPSSELEALAAGGDAALLWPIVLGIVSRAAGLSAADIALACAQTTVSGPAWAAVRLLGLDPFVIVGLLARLAPQIDAVAQRAHAAAGRATSASELPANGSPLQEIAAEAHRRWEVRLFVS